MHAVIFFQFCDNIKNLAKFFTLAKNIYPKYSRNFRRNVNFHCKNSFEICQEYFSLGLDSNAKFRAVIYNHHLESARANPFHLVAIRSTRPW
jgi:hypothetical protein